MFNNLQTTVKFSSVDPPLSRPGTWAYPDMLEVGNLASHAEDRAHFAAWCIISAPLVLGFDLTNSDTMDRVWDIIANPESIAVSQTWAVCICMDVLTFALKSSQHLLARSLAL